MALAIASTGRALACMQNTVVWRRIVFRYLAAVISRTVRREAYTMDGPSFKRRGGRA